MLNLQNTPNQNELVLPKQNISEINSTHKIVPIQDSVALYEKAALDSQSAVNPIEITWKNLQVDIKANKQIKTSDGGKKIVPYRKTILKNLSGTIKPGSFTAILGPSGCGKTTLLNFLSGRLIGSNIEVSGQLLLNGKEIANIDDYSNQIAYVMQDDILLATFTPKEAFKITADLRLRNLNEEQKIERVNNLIKELGLSRCKDTKIGNALIRGVSGGERKRTSIGVELLTNPSMLFLDEPTTGLDSSTALQVVELLKRLSNKGVNVMSTIHQPSSEIFKDFERLILICRGNIIFQGNSNESVPYFNSLGYKLPQFSNPSDYFMKLMNEEGLMVELNQKGQKSLTDEDINNMFEKRLGDLIISYTNSEQVKFLEPTTNYDLQQNDDSFNVSAGKQFFLLFKRSLVSQIRNPMDVFVKIFQMIIFSVVGIIVFQPLGDETSGFQNRAGVLQFIGSSLAFGAIQGSITTFSGERSLFIRERLSRSYGVGAYFWGKNLAELPFHILYPIINVAIIYHSVGLNDSSFKYYLYCHLIMICTFFYSTSYGLIISVLISKADVATSLTPLLVVPLMVLGGYFVNSNNIPVFLKWIEYISMFKYSFQAAALNEFDTINFECTGTCNPLSQLGIKETLGENFIALIVLGSGLRLIAYILMQIISTPSKPKLNSKILKGV